MEKLGKIMYWEMCFGKCINDIQSWCFGINLGAQQIEKIYFTLVTNTEVCQNLVKQF